MKIDIFRIAPEAQESARCLVGRVFMEFVAPDYSEEGVTSFLKFIHNEAMFKDLEVWGAWCEGSLVGVIALDKQKQHIVLFFVDQRYHRCGIGKNLFRLAVKESVGNKITVNSSPFGVPIYEKLGFFADQNEQTVDGIRYTPMTYWKVAKGGNDTPS